MFRQSVENVDGVSLSEGPAREALGTVVKLVLCWDSLTVVTISVDEGTVDASEPDLIFIPP